MSQYESSLRLFEELDGLDDAFIEESLLPDKGALTPIRGRKPRGKVLRRMMERMNSGWGVAVICALVSVGVLAVMIRWGLGNFDVGNTPAPDNMGPAGSAHETVSPEDAMPPRETVPLPDESARVPAGTPSVDSRGLQYVSNGDGTCVCRGLTSADSPTALHIPDYSPDGDAVTALDPYAFRHLLGLTEVTLPAGLRSYDVHTLPMEAEIYRLYGNILYLGSDENPYMVAVSTADNRPGATSLHPHTRLLADRALTYDSGSYFALKWKDGVPAYTDSAAFTLPSSLAYVGEYALLDVGRDMVYNGYLVGWDALTAGEHTGLVRTVDGQAVRVLCLDGETDSDRLEQRIVRLDATASAEDGILYGGFHSYYRGINEDYYRWLKNPDAFDEGPDQFVTVSAVFGTQSRVLTPEELEAVTLLPVGSVPPPVAAFAEAFNRDAASLYAGQSAVMLYVAEPTLCTHTVAEVTVRDGQICVALAPSESDAAATASGRWILIPVSDPEGRLKNATVTYTVTE